MITLDELLAARPSVHAMHPAHDALARFLDVHVRPGDVTLETGAGRSTMVVLRAGSARHIAISPDSAEFDAIREFLRSVDIDDGPLEAVVARSQDYLPGASLPDLDLVLLDGDWGFPTRLIDWYFTVEHLRVGGLLVIDDTHVVHLRMLFDFMDADPRWRLVHRDESAFFAAFEKVRHPVHEHGGPMRDQPYLWSVYPVRELRRIGGPRRPSGLVRVRAKVLRSAVRIAAHLPGPVQKAARRAWRRR